MRINPCGFIINTLVIDGIDTDLSGCMKHPALVKQHARMHDLPILIIKENQITRNRLNGHIYCFAQLVLFCGIPWGPYANYAKQSLYQSGAVRSKDRLPSPNIRTVEKLSGQGLQALREFAGQYLNRLVKPVPFPCIYP